MSDQREFFIVFEHTRGLKEEILSLGLSYVINKFYSKIISANLVVRYWLEMTVLDKGTNKKFIIIFHEGEYKLPDNYAYMVNCYKINSSMSKGDLKNFTFDTLNKCFEKEDS
jgi:hypothetical protein